ncbi:class I SAM-dependent methyltransferase [Acinetobacter nosocomialis]|uniref:class I SAM-dependent methyltransferase n=1 Tax=Acinetobacter nosocomialis TaxID=106654 RepID=UPI001F446225|nr:class I SAM-dependent methyltransferase [Acinetobacter nosocomialis]MCE7531663.1 class I SAM-dependent methyltransferase [Acinetobacter nosocomialis]
MLKNDTYVLNVGNEDRERLNLSDQTYGHATREFLKKLSLNENIKILDVGCGSGNMTHWFSKLVGKNGSVTAVDADIEQVNLTNKIIKDNNLSNVKVYHKSAYDLDIFEDQFDIVFCRFLLIHLDNPLIALKNMKSCLKKNGLLICQEPTTSTHLCMPYFKEFDEANKLTIELGKQKKVNYDIGLELYELFSTLNLDNIHLSFDQPIVSKDNVKIFYMSFNQIKDQILENKLADDYTVENILNGLLTLEKSTSHIVVGFRSTLICGRNS